MREENLEARLRARYPASSSLRSYLLPGADWLLPLPIIPLCLSPGACSHFFFPLRSRAKENFWSQVMLAASLPSFLDTYLGKIEATLLAVYARGGNPPPSPSFFWNEGGTPLLFTIDLHNFIFVALRAWFWGKEGRPLTVLRGQAAEHESPDVTCSTKFNESPRHLIELSVRFEPSFLAEMLSKFYSLKWIRAHKSPSRLSIISELATGILPPFCWIPSPLPFFPSPKLTWIAGWVNIFA